MSCENFYFSGSNTECGALRESIAAMIVCNKGTSLTLANAALLSGWSTLVNPATFAGIKGTIINLKRGYDNKTAEAEMATSNTGYQEKVGENAPAFTGYAVLNYADYMNWFEAENKVFSIYLVLKDGKILGYKNSATTLQGFTGRLFVKNNIPVPGADKQKQSQFDVIFDDIYEWRQNAVQITPVDFIVPQLLALQPFGLDIEILTAYTSGDVVVGVYKRGTKIPYTAFAATTEFEVRSANVLVPAVTAIVATSAALGQYTLTIKKASSPVNLASGDYVVIQGVAIGSSHVTYLTQPLTITA